MRLTRTVAWVGLAAVLGACEPADPQRELLESASTTGLNVLVIDAAMTKFHDSMKPRS